MDGDHSQTQHPSQSLINSEIALSLHEAGSTEETIGLIAEYGRVAVGGDAAGVLIIRSRHRLEEAASTSDAASRAQLLQSELDEGPSLEPAERPTKVDRIDDTTSDPRWPRWCAAVAELGFQSVLLAPLATRERRYGSINVYAHRAGAFDEDDEAVAMILARHAAVALARSNDVEGLRRAIDARKLIGIAMGMLMERFDIGEEQAFDVLRRYSQSHNTKLRDVAEQIVSDRSLPEH